MIQAWRSIRPAVCTALIALGIAPTLHAQGDPRFAARCNTWIEKKGYSTDYIEQRVGQRPSGNQVADWVSNLEPKDAKAGDVVFISSGTERGQRAEVVEEVLTNADGSIRAFRTSSMNIGKMVEPRCNITENFGKVVERTIPFGHVLRAWRADRK